MLKSLVVAGTTALMISAVGLAHAQPGPKGPGPRITAEDSAALTDARIAGLKTGLRLTSEQEKNWPAVEQAIRAAAKERADRRAERSEAREKMREERRAKGADASQESRDARRADRQRPDMVERMRRGADAMTKRAATMTSFADAIEPLYKSLDNDQKRRFAVLIRSDRQYQGHHGHRGRDGHRQGSR